MLDLQSVIKAIEESDLDPVIKNILVRDLKSFGINDFLKEQILAYCDKASEILEKRNSEVKLKNPAD